MTSYSHASIGSMSVIPELKKLSQLQSNMPPLETFQGLAGDIYFLSGVSFREQDRPARIKNLIGLT